MDTTQYLDYIRGIIRDDGWQVADAANKLALQMEHITVKQYSAAARLIVHAYLAG